MRDGQKHILIVGAGLAGTAVAIRMLHYATEPQEITLLEERDDYRHGGVAYSGSGLNWEHVFNIQAGRMSVFREAPDDFINWANKEADRKDWPDEWKEVRFHESSAAPRKIYQDYLQARLQQAKANAENGVKLHVTHGKATDLNEKDDAVEVTITDYKEDSGKASAQKTLKADKVVLATGHEEKEPDAPSVDSVEVRGKHVRRVRRLYSSEGKRAISEVDKNATVYIAGSFLTAYDAAITLLKNGHKGHIVFVSRSGNHPWDYPKNHKHGVIRLSEPEFVKQDLPIAARIDLAFEELDRTLQSLAKPDATVQENNVLIERVLKAWEPHIATLMKKLPAVETRQFTREVLSEFSRIRVGTVPEVGDLIKKSMSITEDNSFPQMLDAQDLEHFLEIHAQLLQKKWTADPSKVIDQKRALIETPSLIIESMPRQTDYAQVQNPLWRNLMSKHKAVPHIKTGQGVQLNADYHLVDANGKASKRVYVTGIPAEGHERETKGRIGPFAFNLAAMKDQSVFIAARVLDANEHSKSVEISTEIRQKAAPVLTPAIASMNRGYIALFVAKTKESRKAAYHAIAVEETGLARTLRSAGINDEAISVIVEEVRQAAKEAALGNVTDISITPSELGSRLKRQIG